MGQPLLLHPGESTIAFAFSLLKSFSHSLWSRSAGGGMADRDTRFTPRFGLRLVFNAHMSTSGNLDITLQA